MIINGEVLELKSQSLKELLRSYELNEDHVVVEVDMKIIDKKLYEETILDKSSRVEIIAFVGGG